MAKKKRQLQVCMKTARDGRRCGRYCAEGETLCSVHLAQAAGKPHGVIKLQDTDDPDVLLRRLMKDSDPAIRLRAIEAILKRQEQAECPRCKATTSRDKQQRRFLEALTADEREALTTIFEQLHQFRETIYARDESLKPESWRPPVVHKPYVYVPPADVEPTSAPPAPVEGAVVTADGEEKMTGEWRPL